MAIDTAAKRASAVRMGLVRPDGTIGQADRQSNSWLYGGILAAAALGTPSAFWTIRTPIDDWTLPIRTDDMTIRTPVDDATLPGVTR